MNAELKPEFQNKRVRKIESSSLLIKITTQGKSLKKSIRWC